MDWVYVFYITGLGLAVGSFLNVVVLRYHTGRTVLGRSSCASCAHKLSWFDLVPLASFVLLRGKCRYCRARISFQYPLVELLTAFLFFLAARQFLAGTLTYASLLHFVTLLLALPFLVAIVVYDIRHKIIPDALAYGFAFVGIMFRTADVAQSGFTTAVLLDLAAGPLLFFPFFLLWFFSKGRWMGLGDGKLALGIGWLLGLSGGVLAVLFGFWSGALVGLFLVALTHLSVRRKGVTKVSLKSEVPFAPFLILGVIDVLFFGLTSLFISMLSQLHVF